MNPSDLTAGVYTGSVGSDERDDRAESDRCRNVAGVGDLRGALHQQERVCCSPASKAGRGVPSQSFAVLSLGQGTLAWTVRASTLDGGSWLSVSPESGQSVADSLEVPEVDVRVNVTGLPSGSYSGGG